jgi:hypothetical protein
MATVANSARSVNDVHYALLRHPPPSVPLVLMMSRVDVILLVVSTLHMMSRFSLLAPYPTERLDVILHQNKSICPLLTPNVLCAHSHFFSDFIISPKHFLMDGIFEGSEFEGAGSGLCGWCGRSVHLSLCFLCCQTFVWLCIVMLKEDSASFV